MGVSAPEGIPEAILFGAKDYYAIAAIPKIISSVVNAILGSIPQLVSAGVQLFVALIENLPTIIVEVVKTVPQIMAGIVDAFGGFFGTMAEIGSI